MIPIPNRDNAFEYELQFLLTCGPTRIAKILCLYEAYKQIHTLPGAIVECGVFKGASFSIFAALRALLENPWMRELVAFDGFDMFAKPMNDDDKQLMVEVADKAGLDCISKEQLFEVLESKATDSKHNIQLIEGDICETVPKYFQDHPEFRIALLSIDVDFAEPTQVILDYFYERVVPGGIILFDDYGTFPGETKVADKFMSEQGYRLNHFGFSRHPCFIVKRG